MSEKTYLGDGVYARVVNGSVVLTTEDGLRATNTIFLEPEVFAKLLRFATPGLADKASKDGLK